MSFLKQSVKRILIRRQHKKYEKKLAEKQLTYDDWIRLQETKLQENVFASEKAQKNCRFLTVSLTDGKIEESGSLLSACKEEKADAVLFVLAGGELAEITKPLLAEKFLENENIILIYGDEDVIAEGKRCRPWLKPDFSPDTFLSCFYFGSLVAIRSRALLELLSDGESTDIYSLCCRLLQGPEAGKKERVCHISEVLFHGEREGYPIIRDWKLSDDLQKAFLSAKIPDTKPLISVIIPSKDNPEVLFTCLHSFLDKTVCEYPFELLIIDNGSREENKKRMEEEVQKLSACRPIRYFYEPMTFNFSRMCNLGAAHAEGSLLLFLNDDMEIIQENWLTLLADKAMLPYAGAVGAKLLYPDSDKIQHAGITNLRVGPAHKLQFLSDGETHYYGKNRGVHDVMAVTGACLLVRKEVFEKAGGFAEELAVAFNDVDFCYTLYETGYYNMVRNDVALYHHESLSRGKDGESEEKQQRLLREKDVLYERHQSLYGKDPFYHKYLTTDMLESEYSPALRYQVTLDMPWAEVKEEERLSEKIREDACVVLGMECAMDIYKWKYGVSPDKGKVKPKAEDMGYYFQGYSFVIGSDNACYKKTLILENRENGRILKVVPDERFRPDIRNNLKDQVNVDLTGFAAKVSLEKIPEGTYRFGMLAEDACSRQKLLGYSSWILTTGKEEKNGL